MFLHVILPFLLVRGGRTEPGHAAPQANSAFLFARQLPADPQIQMPVLRSADERVSPSLARERGRCPGAGLAGGCLPYHRLAGRIADGPEFKPPSTLAHLPAMVINKSVYDSFLLKAKHMLANTDSFSPRNLKLPFAGFPGLPAHRRICFPQKAAAAPCSCRFNHFLLGVWGVFVCLFNHLLLCCAKLFLSASHSLLRPSACCYSWHPNQC